MNEKDMILKEFDKFNKIITEYNYSNDLNILKITLNRNDISESQRQLIKKKYEQLCLEDTTQKLYILLKEISKKITSHFYNKDMCPIEKLQEMYSSSFLSFNDFILVSRFLTLSCAFFSWYFCFFFFNSFNLSSILSNRLSIDALPLFW